MHKNVVHAIYHNYLWKQGNLQKEIENYTFYMCHLVSIINAIVRMNIQFHG